MLRASDVDRASYVIDKSEAAVRIDEILESGRKKSGRRSALSTRTLLIGMLLTAMDGEGLVLTSVHRTLTESIPVDKQIELGVRRGLGGRIEISQDAVDRRFGRILTSFQFGRGTAPELSDDERTEVQNRLLDMINSLIDVTLEPVATTGVLAIDATSVWSFGRNPGKQGIASIREAIAHLREQGDEDEAQQLESRLKLMIKETRKGRKAMKELDLSDPEIQEEKVYLHGYDPDARSGAKTGKDGSPEWVYGYDVHATVRVAAPK